MEVLDHVTLWSVDMYWLQLAVFQLLVQVLQGRVD